MNWDPKSAEKLDFNEDYYTLLEVDPLINQRELKKAYYKIVFKYHPDGKQTEREKLLSNKQMMVINAAYKVLKDPIAREKYDIKRRSAASSKPPSSSYTSSRATSSTASSNVYRERPSSVNSEYSNSPFSNYFQNEQEDQVTESLSDVVSELIKDVLSPDGRKGLLDEFVSFLEGVDDRRDTANDLSSSQIELVRDAAKNLKVAIFVCTSRSLFRHARYCIETSR
jgi:curved DNA-binding protein CbpA